MDALQKAMILKNSPTDISNFRNKYTYFDGTNNVKFDSVLINGIQKYLLMLKENSENISMEKRYYMRPEYVAYDFYGTTNLGFLIMYVNNCSSSIDFVIDNILVPKQDIVAFVLSKCKKYIKEVNLNDIL